MKLYKYRPINDHTRDIFRNRKIYFSKPEKFNDPFDLQFKFIDDITVSKHIKQESLGKEHKRKWMIEEIERNGWTDKVKQESQAGHKIIYDMFKNMGILTLSEEKDNILMWSHYAKYHTGLCIEFEVPVKNELVKVTYPHSEDYPKILFSDIIDWKNTDNLKSIQKILETKSIKWNYENERRLYVKEGNTEVDFKEFGGEITAVYFGCECEKQNIDDIKSLCKDVKNIYKYKKSDSAYKLEIDEKYF